MEIREKQSLTGLHGWIPITEKNLPYELTASFLLMADKPGIPLPIKLQEQHRALFPLDQPITEESGMRLAAWAKGGTSPPAPVLFPDAAQDWATVISDAQTREELLEVNRRLKAAKDTMSADALAALRVTYDARLKALSGAGERVTS
jgi:hypothetical protein